MGWYMTRDGVTRYGPYTEEQLRELANAGRLLPTDMVWREGMDRWAAASSVPGLTFPPPAPLMPPPAAASGSVSHGGNRIAAGVCGILLGSLGIHKFIIGLTGPGIIMLLVTLLTCGIGGVVMSIIGIIEGIIYLSKSDEEFYQTYIVGKKGWF
ncbi:MAG: GYF domain-containing protein [Thermoguttaceae bacterium]|nr:GYF domain-containing protein [Thermoguttaceae bacterium]MDW8036567.1 GYF domain-containing protein [Thermoguttaceae bacterium]